MEVVHSVCLVFKQHSSCENTVARQPQAWIYNLIMDAAGSLSLASDFGELQWKLLMQPKRNFHQPQWWHPGVGIGHTDWIVFRGSILEKCSLSWCKLKSCDIKSLSQAGCCRMDQPETYLGSHVIKNYTLKLELFLVYAPGEQSSLDWVGGIFAFSTYFYYQDYG